MNILLIDDHALFREGFKLMLARMLPEVARVVETGSAEAGLAAVAEESFDLIFLDLGLPGLGGGRVGHRTLLALTQALGLHHRTGLRLLGLRLRGRGSGARLRPSRLRRDGRGAGSRPQGEEPPGSVARSVCS